MTFEEAYSRHAAGIFNYLYRLVGDRAMAEDLTQDAFARAWKRWDSLDQVAPAATKGWLYRIATNVGLDELRRRKVVRFTPLDPALPVRARQDVLGELVREEAHREIREAVQQLPEHYAVPLLLYANDVSYDRMAGMLGTTHGAIKSRLYRAREELRERCADRAVLA